MAEEAARPATIAVAGAEFGWGSAGKLAAILDELRERHGERVRFLGLNSTLGRPVLARAGVDDWVHAPAGNPEGLRVLLRAHRVAAAVIVLDAELAAEVEEAGCPVVYADSLPFLWTGHEPVPSRVHAYCAQLCPALPSHCWPTLRGIESLHWVGPITGLRQTVAGEAKPGKAVVNVGGLRSPFSVAGDEAYLDLVLTPALTALEKAGFDHVVVAGNLDPAGLSRRLSESSTLSVSGGRLDRGDFLEELRTAELVLTSPGRTTLLELAALDQRAVVLPPQNISQTVNAQDVADLVEPGVVVRWPVGVLDPAELAARRELGEEEAVRYMYARFAATTPSDCATEIGEALSTAIRLAQRIRMAPFSGSDGRDGAVQIADLVDPLIQQATAALSGVPQP